jgi:hypothetical protein
MIFIEKKVSYQSLSGLPDLLKSQETCRFLKLFLNSSFSVLDGNIVIDHYCVYTACVYSLSSFDSFFLSIYLLYLINSEEYIDI